MCSFKDLACVRLKHDPFSRAEGANIHYVMIALWKLVQKIMLVALRLQIDVELRPTQGFEVALYIGLFGVTRHQETDHKSRVYYLSETLLFRNVHRGAEEASRLRFSIHEQRQPVQE